MTITTTKLTRAAGLSAVVGGLLYIAVQIKHPHLDAAFATTTEYAVREAVKILMTVLSLIGITGIYLRQVKQTGMLGLIGYAYLAIGYLVILCVQVVGLFVLPTLAASQPGYVNDVFAVVTSGTPTGDIGGLQTLIQGGIAYIVGGTIFGIALFRANILPRWAAALLSVGAVATLATSLLPELTQRLFPIPVGIALIGLGYSLWREQRTPRPLPSAIELPARPGQCQVTIHVTARPTRSTRSTGRWVPFALVALVLVPAFFGALRLVELAGGPTLIPASPRFAASPVPVVVHIVSALAYAILGAFQFSAALRRRRPGWHRMAGRVLVLLGLAVALSALWLTQFLPRQPGTGELAYVFRLAFATGMAASIVLGFTAIRRGNVARHRAWMTRAYALALGAGTQVFTLGIGPAVFGPSALTHDLSLGAAWAINLAVAEYVIRRTVNRRTLTRRTIGTTTVAVVSS